MRVKRQPEKLHHPSQWAVYVVSDSDRKYKAGKQRYDETHGDSPASDSSTEYGVAEYRGEVMTHSRGCNAEYGKGKNHAGVSLKNGLGLGGVLTSITSCLGSSHIDDSLRNTELMHYCKSTFLTLNARLAWC